MTVLTDAPSEAPAAVDPAPFGWMKDPITGKMRPKKRPGRQRKSRDPEPSPVPESEEPGERDPAPAWADGTEQKTKKRQSIADVPKQVVDDIAGFSGLVATPILALLQQADPYCGTVLAQNFGSVMEATLPLICRSEKIVRYFSEDKSDWMLWGKLAIALSPVAKAIADHHIFHTVEVRRDENTGQVQVMRVSPGSAHDGNLVPPTQAEYNQSDYAA